MLPTLDYGTCPHPQVFRQLADAGPVGRVCLPGGIPVWVITDQAEGRRALNDSRLIKDPTRFSSLPGDLGRQRQPEDVTIVLGRQVLNTDAEHHDRLRAVLAPLLSRTSVQRWQPLAAETAAVLLDRVAAWERFDLVADFAVPLTSRVLAQVLGIPEQPAARALDLGRTLLGPEHPNEPHMRAALIEFDALVNQFAEAACERDARDRVVPAVMAAADAKIVTMREAVSLVGTAILGSASPPCTLIAVSAACVLAQQGLRASVAAGRAADVVEEVLRFQPPVAFSSWRFAAEDHEIAGTPVARGDAVVVLIAAANRDPACVTEGGQMRLDRHPSPAHLSFGHGKHFCLGAPLARLMASAALPPLLERLSGQVLLTGIDEIRWHGVLGDRRPLRIDVAQQLPERSVS
ncbi:cytochrome P450 [Streptomyces sp. P5-A9]|uniref:cytochrome P450 n=2 Tax=unclassified Streptomyces TaxID=2593676 RepID=UPI002FC81807